MKKCLILMVAVLVFVVGSVAMADEIPAGSVEFDVIWEVEPMILFAAGIGGFGGDLAVYNNDDLLFGDLAFGDYVFDTQSPSLLMPFFGTQEIEGPAPIWALVASNDKWRVQFKKPVLVSDNDQYTTVPVYATRDLYELASTALTTKDWFSGNDTITKDLGIYGMLWNLKVEYNNWHTRSGVYENTYEIVCTQL